MRRSKVITNYSINYSTDKNHYDFFDAEKTIRDFISAVNCKFVSKDKAKVQGSVEIINYQPADEIDQLIELESRRTRLTDVCTCVYFNVYVQREISKSLMKGVTINGMTGSSWRFKRFERLPLIVISVGANFGLG